MAADGRVVIDTQLVLGGRQLPLLTERGQTALGLAYGERKSWAEIGAALGMKASGVKTLLRRCRDTLRACIDKNTDSTPGATR